MTLKEAKQLRLDMNSVKRVRKRLILNWMTCCLEQMIKNIEILLLLLAQLEIMKTPEVKELWILQKVWNLHRMDM